jgi:hypothetical protein
VTLATALAILGALNGSAEVILKITEMLKASGHSLDTPLPPEHLAAILASLDATVATIPDAEWDADHANSGG